MKEFGFIRTEGNSFTLSYKGKIVKENIENYSIFPRKTDGLSILGIEEITLNYPNLFIYDIIIENFFRYSENDFVNCLINLNKNEQFKYLGIEDLFTSKNNYVSPREIDYLFFDSEYANKIILPILKYGYSNCVYAVFSKEIILNSKLKENMKNVKYKPMWVNAYLEVIPDFV